MRNKQNIELALISLLIFGSLTFILPFSNAMSGYGFNGQIATSIQDDERAKLITDLEKEIENIRGSIQKSNNKSMKLSLDGIENSKNNLKVQLNDSAPTDAKEKQKWISEFNNLTLSMDTLKGKLSH